MNGEYDELDFSQAHDLVKKRQRYFRRPKKPADLLAKLMARKGYAVNQQLGFQKRKILAELKAQLPQNKFTDIRFRIGNVN